MSEATSGGLLDVPMRIWNEKLGAARRVKHHVSVIMGLAVTRADRENDPAGETIDGVVEPCAEA